MSASALGDQSWQSILDLLTSKAKKDGLLASVKNAKGFEAKINKVRDSIFIRLVFWKTQNIFFCLKTIFHLLSNLLHLHVDTILMMLHR